MNLSAWSRLGRLVVRGALPALAAVCLTACSEETFSPPEQVSPELEPLYMMIHEYRQDYENGLELILSGEQIAGENVLAAATDRISVAAQLCARTEGCDNRLFMEAMVQVASERQELFAAKAEDGELEEPDETLSDVDDPAHARRPAVVLGESELREMIPLNDAVRTALNDWLTWNRPGLMDAWENYQYLRPQMAPIYEEAGLPEALLFAILAKETGAKVHAYSRAGAVGPLQFMRHTARRYGLRSVNGFDMRLDPVASTQANVAYLTDQFQRFDYDLELALAAYNGGESRVRRLHRKLNADFWDPRLHFALPSETRDYVPQILAAALLFLHPEAFGLEFHDHETTATMMVLAEEISIGELTICLGQESNPNGWFRTLRNLNPRLRPSVRSEAGESIRIPSKLVPIYAERCVEESPLLVLARELHDADFPEQPAVVRYTVRRGDTLAKIAARHGCRSVRELAAVNGIEGPGYTIHVGQRLSVPTCS